MTGRRKKSTTVPRDGLVSFGTPGYFDWKFTGLPLSGEEEDFPVHKTDTTHVVYVADGETHQAHGGDQKTVTTNNEEQGGERRCRHTDEPLDPTFRGKDWTMKDPKPRGDSPVKKPKESDDGPRRNPEKSSGYSKFAKLFSRLTDRAERSSLVRLYELREALPDPREYIPLVPSKYYGHPDWWEIFTIDREGDRDPVNEITTRIVTSSPEAEAQRHQTNELEQAFRDALPEVLKEAWLDWDVRNNERRLMDQALYFNVGVEMGRDMCRANQVLERAGFDVDKTPPESLFRLAQALKEIAERLTLRSSSSGGDSSA